MSGKKSIIAGKAGSWLALLAAGWLAGLAGGCGEAGRVVVVYTSQDQVYAEPMLREFTRQTGIKALPVFDSESVKTAGLAQRLLAERGNPRADIFWSNEEMISRRLAELGALDTNAWQKAGYRTRRLIVNTNFVPLAEAPRTLAELAAPKWAGKVALAYPVYGTTAAHMVAMRQECGDAKWQEWCRKLAANRPMVVDGNSLVVRLVGSGEAWIGLTDSDDVAAGERNGMPIACVPAGRELLTISSSVGIVRGAPNRAEAEAFYKFAQAQETLAALVAANALEGISPAADSFEMKETGAVEETRDVLKTIFARR